MGVDEIRCFLSHLAVGERVSASTQNQALCALIFLYRRVVGLDLAAIEGIERANPARRVPLVLTRVEVKNVLDRMNGVPKLAPWLLYGAGLRLLECLSLRVKDVDFDRNEITVRDGKGAKDRVTMLPAFCRQALQTHLGHVRELHGKDLCRGLGHAPLPFTLAVKYPRADRREPWRRPCGAPGWPSRPPPTPCAIMPRAGLCRVQGCSTDMQHAGSRIGTCGSGSRSSARRTGGGWPKCLNCPVYWLTVLPRLRLRPTCRRWPFESLPTASSMARPVQTSSTSPSTLRDQLAEHPGANARPPLRCEELAQSPDRGWLQTLGGNKFVFSRVLTTVRAGEVKDGVTLAHDGIDDYFAGKASVVWYWESGRWRRLLGWD